LSLLVAVVEAVKLVVAVARAGIVNLLPNLLRLVLHIPLPLALAVLAVSVALQGEQTVQILFSHQLLLRVEVLVATLTLVRLLEF
jgi:hypothetical protein